MFSYIKLTLKQPFSAFSMFKYPNMSQRSTKTVGKCVYYLPMIVPSQLNCVCFC